MDGGELKCELAADGRYRGLVVVPTTRDGGVKVFCSISIESEILDAYQSAAERAVCSLVIEHKITVLDYHHKTLTITVEKLEKANVKVTFLEK